MLTVPEDEKEAQDLQIRVTLVTSALYRVNLSGPIPDKGLKKRIQSDCPPRTLIVWGTEDKLVPPAYAEEFGSRIAGSQIAMGRTGGSCAAARAA